jgi:hypothetical protein
MHINKITMNKPEKTALSTGEKAFLPSIKTSYWAIISNYWAGQRNSGQRQSYP